MEGNEYIESLILKHLHQEASRAEQAELQQWLDADPLHRQEFEAVGKIWKQSGPALHLQQFDKDAAWEKIQPSMATAPLEKAQGLGTLKRMLIAASVLLLLISAGWWFYTRNNQGKSRLILAQEADQQVALPDGSMVYLRKGSSLHFTGSFNRKTREVELSGEAFFQLVNSPQKPFRIRTAHAVIEDLGTSLLVKGRETSDEVIVTAGKIKFTDRVRSSNSIVLGSGEKGMLKENKFIQSAVADSNFLSWKTGVLDFHDKPLEVVVQDIGNFYRIAVSISPDLLTEPGKNKITARFEKQPLAEVLEEIRMITGLNIKQDKDSLFFSRK